jgi:hypothetical protein
MAKYLNPTQMLRLLRHEVENRALAESQRHHAPRGNEERTDKEHEEIKREREPNDLSES